MKRSIGLALMGFALAACNRTAPADGVASLMAHPDRLRQVEKACAGGHASMEEAACRVASEARHRLFMGNGPRYTPPRKTPKF